MFRNRNFIAGILLLFFFLSAAFLMGGCKKKPAKAKPHPRPVKTAVALKKDVPLYIDSFGTLSADKSVNIEPQVTGKIKKSYFSEGDNLSKGDLLFTIDPSEYNAELQKAKAVLAQDTVDLKFKKETVQRNQKLIKKNLISQEEYDKYQVDAAAAQASVHLDKANVELAKINLGYCYIRSPINGIAGSKNNSDAGNIVTANSGITLVNIKYIDTLDLDFSVPEKHLPVIRKAMSKQKLKVEVTLEGDKNDSYSGLLDSMDNKVDDLTGTISLKAIVQNKDRILWPGQFVQVKLITGTQKDAIVVPYQAVQLGQKGPYLFVVTQDNKADLRLVETGQRHDDNIVINKGVNAGEKVVTVGQLGLSKGVDVADVTQQKKSPETKKVSKK